MLSGSFSSDPYLNEKEVEISEKNSIAVFRWLFPVLDALHQPWPGVLVFAGMCLETFQLCALILNNVYPWGSIIRGVSIPVYFTILPFWDQSYFAHANYLVNTLFFWVLTIVLLALTGIMTFYLVKLHAARIPVLPGFARTLLFLLVGPFFLPSLHLVLSMLVCDGGYKRDSTTAALGGSASPTQSLTAFSEQQCFVSLSYPLIVFGFGVVAAVLLVLPKALVTFLVYEDNPLTSSPRGRSHSVMEGWLFVYEIVSAVLFHFLPAVGQRDMFAGLHAVAAFLLLAGFCLYMPYFSIAANRLRVMGLACIFFCALVTTVSLALGEQSVLYTGSNQWDVLVLCTGCVLMCIVGYHAATFRVSRQFLRDLRRAEHGLPAYAGALGARGRGVGAVPHFRGGNRTWRFPHYLPKETRTEQSEADVFAQPMRSSMATASLVGSMMLGSSLFGGSAVMQRSCTSHGSLMGYSKTDMSSCNTVREEVGGCDTMSEDVVLSSFIDAVYTPTDVELATRFLAYFMRTTSLLPSTAALGFSAQIYIKGLSKFVYSDWLKLQYAAFLAAYSSHLNPLGNALCAELASREVGVITSYRLHRHMSAIDAVHLRNSKLYKRSFQLAVSVHKETLVNVNNFWKQLELDQVGVSQLGRIAFAVMDGCSSGMNRYVRALRHRVDTVTLVRYAQFLDYVALDAESAGNMRETAVDLIEKRQAGLISRDVPNLALREASNPSSQYSRESRRLRRFLAVFCTIILLALLAFLVIVCLSHQNDLHLIDNAYYAALCRFLILRTMLAANMALTAAQTSNLWDTVRTDLTTLREANALLTYSPNLQRFAGLVNIMRRTLYVFFYGNTGEYNVLGMWRIGEAYISTLESLVTTESSADERSEAYSVFLSNQLSGAASAYNASLGAFIDEQDRILSMSTALATSLFAFSFAMLLIVFFVLRCHLARISGTRLSVLGLFRLIPRNALKMMIAKMSDHIEHFDDPDPIFERMLAERNVSEEGRTLARSSMTGSRIAAGSTLSSHSRSSVGSRSRASAGRLESINSPNIAGVHGSALDETPPALVASAVPPVTSDAVPVDMNTSGSGVGASANPGPDHHGSDARQSRSGDAWRPGDDNEEVFLQQTTHASAGNGGDMFAKLAKSSSVADYGRIRPHNQGQFEAPYKRDAYTPRALSKEELRERQRVVDDALVDEVLGHVKSTKTSRGGHDATLSTSADDGHSSGSNRITENSVSRRRLIMRASTGTYQAALIALSVLCVIFGVVAGLLALERQKLMLPSYSSQVPLVQSLQEYTFLVTGMIDTAEAMVYYPEDPQSLPNLLSALEEARLGGVDLSAYMDFQVSTELAAHEAKFRTSLKLLNQQVLAAAMLSCLAMRENGAVLDCEELDSVTWTKSSFIPTTKDHILFDNSLKLPQGKADDILASTADKLEMSLNVLTSSYYEYLKSSMHSSFRSAKRAIQSEVLAMLNRDVHVNKSITLALLVFSTLLVVAFVVQFLMVCIVFRDKHLFAFVLACCCICSIVCLAFSGMVYNSLLPQDRPYTEILSRFAAVETVYMSEYEARENAKRAAFLGVQLAVINYEPSPDTATDVSWIKLLNIMEGAYVERIGAIYIGFQYCRFLQTIAVVMGCQYNAFEPIMCALPKLADFNWDINEESFGYRTSLQYAGTPQLLYSSRNYDMNVLTPAEQLDLAKSLVFGQIHREKYNQMVRELLEITPEFCNEQLHVAEARYASQKPIVLTVSIMSYVLAVVSFVAILFLTVGFAEARHLRAGLRTTAGSSISANSITDNSFKQLERRTALILMCFVVLLVAFYCVCIADSEAGRTNDAVIDTIALRNVHLIKSAVSLENSIHSSWILTTAKSFAQASVTSSESYYQAVGMHFSNAVATGMFGSPAVTFWRYDRGMATNTTVTDFSGQPSVLAFDGLVDLSQRRWYYRMLSIATMDRTLREHLNTALYPEVIQLSELSRESSRIITNSVKMHRTLWFYISVVLFCVMFAVYLLTVWHLLGPVVNRLIKEEEGTQVMLRMIPAEIRRAVPAIAEYMSTGRIVQDANIAEVDAMASEFSVLPMIAIDVNGIITYFSRAAEETFLWSAAEAVGQNVSILMPDNIAIEHDDYLRNYMQRGVQRAIGNVRTMRAKRKDGTLFPATVQVSEVREGDMGGAGGSGVAAFVGVVRSCQAEVEFERTCRLATSLTDSIIVPVVVTDTAGVIVKFSKAAEQVFKCSAADVLGRKVNALMPRMFADQHDAHVERYWRSEQRKYLGSTRFICAKRLNGEIFSAQVTLNELRIGGADYAIAYLEDMSERLHLETLAAAGSMAKTVSPIPLVIADSEGRMVFCSRSVARVFGYELEEITNQPISILMDDSWANLHKNAFAAYIRRTRGSLRRIKTSAGITTANDNNEKEGLEAARTMTGVARRREVDGTYTFFAVRLTIKGFVVEGKGPHVLAFIEDISAKQVLMTKSDVGRSITQFSAIPVVLVTDSGSVVDMNPAAEAALGWTVGEVYGASVNTFFKSNTAAASAREPTAAPHTVVERTHQDLQGRNEPAGRARADAAAPAPNSQRSQNHYTPANPIDKLLDEYKRTGNSTMLGRYIKATAVRKWKVPVEKQSHQRRNPGSSAVHRGDDDDGGGRGPSGEYSLARSIENTMVLGESVDSFSPSSQCFPVEVYIKETQLEDGKHFLVYMRDASHDQRLLEANHWNDVIMTASTVPVVCASSDDGIIFSCSDSVCSEFHRSREELVGQHVRVLLADDSPPTAANTGGGARAATGSDSHPPLNTNLTKLLRALEVARRRTMHAHHRKGERGFKGLDLLGVSSSNVMSTATTISPNEEGVIITGRTRDGAEFPISVLVQEVHVEGTKPFFIATMRNCKKDMILSGQNSMAQALADQSPVPFISISATGIITELSRAAEKQFGYLASEVVGQNVRLLMSDEIGAHHDGYLRSYAKTRVGRMVNNTSSLMARRKDGTFFQVELFVKEIVYSAGKNGTETVEFVSYSCDMTETTRLRNTLKVKEAVAALTSVAMIETTESGVIVRYNDLAAEEFGLPTASSKRTSVRGSVHSVSLYDLFPQDVQDDSDVAVNQGTWLADVIAELDSLIKAGGPLNAAGRREESSADKGDDKYPTVTRELLGRRRGTSSFRCAVSVSFVDERDPPSPFSQGTSPTSSPPAEGAGDPGAATANAYPPERRVRLHVRNLSSDFKLRLHRELITSTMELLPVPVLQISDSGLILLVNRAVEDVLGFPPAELVDRSVVDVLPPDSAQTAQLLLSRFQMTGVRTIADMDPGKDPGFSPLTLRVVRKGGASVRMRVHVREVTSEQGKPTFLCGLTDLSTPMAMEAEFGLQDALTRHSPIAVFTTDHKGVITDCSRKMEELLQSPTADLVGKPVSIIKAYPLVLATTRAAQVADGGDFFLTNMTFKESSPSGADDGDPGSTSGRATSTKPVQDQVVVTRRDGSTFRAKVRIFPILPWRAKYPSYAAYVEDVEQALTMAPRVQVASRILDASPGAVLVVNVEGAIESFNAAALQLLHCSSPDDLRHLHVSQLVVQPRGKARGAEEDDPVVERSVEEAPLLVALDRLAAAITGYVSGAAQSLDSPTTADKHNITVHLFSDDGTPSLSVPTVLLRRRDGAGEVMVNATLTVTTSALDSNAMKKAGAGHHSTATTPKRSAEVWGESESLLHRQRFIVISMNDVTPARLANETKRRESALAATAFTAIMELDTDAAVLFVSRNLVQRLGYGDASDLVGRRYTSLFLGGDPKVDDFLRMAKQSPQSTNAHTRQHVFYLLDKSGVTRRTTGEMHVTRKPDGSVQSVLLFLRLPQSVGSWLGQLGLPAMSLSTEAMILVTGASDGVVACSNAAANKLFGVPAKASLVGAKLDSILTRNGHAKSRKPALGVAAPPSSSAATTVAGGLFNHLRRHATGKQRAVTLLAAPFAAHDKRSHEQTRGETRHGSTSPPDALVPVEVDTRELSDSAGGDTGSTGEPLLLLHIHSIVEEQEIALRKRVIDATVEFAVHAAVVIDAGGNISLFSRAAERLFGLSEEAALGKAMLDLLLDSESAATMRQAFALFRHRQNCEVLSTPKRVTALLYGHSPTPGVVGPVTATRVVEVTVEQMPVGEVRSLYEHVAFFIAK